MIEQTLVLNASYEPLKIVDWPRAVTLWCQGTLEIVAEHDREVRAVTFTFRRVRPVQSSEGRAHAPSCQLASAPRTAWTGAIACVPRHTLGLRKTPECWRDYLYWNAALEE